VTVWAASDIELGRAYVRGGKDIYYQVPEELDYFKIKPTLTPDNEEFGVWIGNDGMSSIYDDSEKGRGPVYLKYEPGSPDPIPITITSAYDLTRKDYLLYLTKTPVLCAGGGNSELLPGGLTCADASYDTSYGTSGITWTQMEQSTDGRTRSYYAYVPDSVSKVDLTFEFENPAVTEDVYLILPDDSQEYFANLPVTKTISLASGENRWNLTYKFDGEVYNLEFYVHKGSYINTVLTAPGSVTFAKLTNNLFKVLLELGSGGGLTVMTVPTSIDVIDPVVIKHDPDTNAEIVNDTVVFSNLKYGLNRFTLRVTDRLGSTHDYKLHIWNGKDIGLAMEYMDTSGTRHDAGKPMIIDRFDTSNGTIWQSYDFSITGRTASEIDEVRLIIDDKEHGFSYYVSSSLNDQGEMPEFDEVARVWTFTFKDVIAGNHSYYVHIVDSNGNVLIHEIKWSVD